MLRMRFGGWLIAMATAMFGVSGCSSPTQPSPPFEGGPSIQSGSATLTGTVMLSGAPLQTGGKVEVTVAGASTTVTLGPNGEYRFERLPVGATVRLLYHDHNSGPHHQPCAAYTTLTASSVKNIELYPLGMGPSNAPTLSGLVFRRDEQGTRIPLSVNLVYHRTARTRSDESGRYSFCGLPPGTGYLDIGVVCNEQAPSEAVSIPADTIKDIDVTGWFNACWYPVEGIYS